MAKCGCNTTQSTTCEAIMTCIATAIGAGLDYNEATGNLELAISSDAGNVAAIGSDGGFWSPAGSAPGPMSWPKTVATLPDQAISATGGSNLLGPSTSPQLIEYAIAQDLDIYTIGVYALADAVAFESVGSLDSSITSYTDNPSAVDYRYIDAGTLLGLSYDAGTRVNPTGRNSGAPEAFLSPDGGWAGFYAHPYAPRTVSALLRIVRGRMVVAVHAQRLALTEAQTEAGLRSIVEAVVDAGAQEWTIVYVPAALDDDSRAPIDQWVPIVTGAGITAGVSSTMERNMATPFTGAEIAASGAEWVEVRSPGSPGEGGVSDARITELVDAGLQVSVFTNSRQYWTQHAFGLGARTVRAADGVYARGGRGLAGDLDYRQNFVPGLETRTTAVGALTPQTDETTAVFNAGFARADETGRWFPERYGWLSDLARVNNHQLLGSICPHPNTTDYRIAMRIWRPDYEQSITTLQSAGFWFAAPTDRTFVDYDPDGVGYTAWVHPLVTGSESWQNMELVRQDGSGSRTVLAESIGVPPGWGENEWTDLEVTVLGATISFTATNSTGTATISADDSTYRGAYAFYAWYETSSRTIMHGYDNPTDLVMYEALS